MLLQAPSKTLLRIEGSYKSRFRLLVQGLRDYVHLMRVATGRQSGIVLERKGCDRARATIPAKSAAKYAQAPDGRHRLCAGDESGLNRLQ